MQHVLERDSTPPVRLRALVFESLNNAEENGFFEEGFYLHGATVDTIVDDLKDCDSECAPVPAAELRPHVEAWLLRREEASA